MRISSIVIIGATSGIAQGVARLYAERGWKIFLVARNADALQAMASDLKSRGASDVGVLIADLCDTTRHGEIVSTASRFSGNIDVVLIAHGVLKNQQEIDNDPNAMLKVFDVNAVSTISLMQRFASALEPQKSGTVAVISSVAGERGRRTLYTYGATKAAVSHFAAGLRARYLPLGINILNIKPGPVDTPMMAGRTQALIAPVSAVARDIVRAIDSRKGVIYTPWFWRHIMTIIKMIPERIFVKINF
ncbi:MAG: SDR family NAD(P)-dependent oxidoreductase [Candidatus Kapabacteria bacterium]|nr:SDR family NAD(P)-dependent oxidoreductase [Candidatus Kapabacteria bacterium]